MASQGFKVVQKDFVHPQYDTASFHRSSLAPVVGTKSRNFGPQKSSVSERPASEVDQRLVS